MRVSCNTVAGQNYNHTPKKKVLFIIKRTFPVLFPNLKCHSLVSSNKTAAESSWLILLYCRVNASHFRPMAVFLWPDYRKYLSPEILYIPYKWFAPQTPLKKIRKIRKKFQAKASQRHVTCLNLKKKFQISFSQFANNVGTPFFQIHAQGSKYKYPCTQSAGGVPK